MILSPVPDLSLLHCYYPHCQEYIPMNSSLYARLLVPTLLLGSVVLISGCAGMEAGFPDSVGSSQTVGPPMDGTVFGGHAPVTGAHVYLLQPGTSGIGSSATSLLGNNNATSANGFPLITNPTGGDPFVPANAKYVVSNSQANFSFTGAYNCTSGEPVYAYAYEGNPGTVNNTAIVQLAILGDCPTVGNLNFGSSSTDPINFIYLNEVSTVAAAYVFQPFTSAANNNAVDIGSSGTAQGLVGIENAALTAAQLYNIQGGTQLSTTPIGEGHIANFQTLLNGVANNGNGIVPQATIDTLANILAGCVDGASGASSAGCTTLFANATDNGLTTGTKPTDTATAAINIARYPAGNFSSTTNTPTNFVTNIWGLQSATVPYTPHLTVKPNDFTIAINYPATALTTNPSANNPLLTRAESIAVDNTGQLWITAQGAVAADASVVRWNSQGVQNSSHFAGYIYGYVSIDGNNNAWAGNADTTTGIEEFGINGVLTNTFGANYNKAYTLVTDQAGDLFFYASDTSGDAEDTCITPAGFRGRQTCDSEQFEMNSSGAVISSSTRCNSVTGTYEFYCITSANTPPTSVFDTGSAVSHGAIESKAAGANLWLTTEISDQIGRVSPTGTAVFTTITTPGGTGGNHNQPEFPSIDGQGNAWIPIQATDGEVYRITPTGGQTILTAASTGALMTSTFGSAVDGNGNVWVSNRSGNYGSVSGVAGTNSIFVIHGGTATVTTGNNVGTPNLAISPTTNYIPEAQYVSQTGVLGGVTKMLDDSLNVAIDPSGNVWITNYLGNAVVEIVGAAAPVVTPLSLAAGTNKLGTTP